MTQIHSTAIIEQGARLGEGAVIGPYCCVGGIPAVPIKQWFRQVAAVQRLSGKKSE